MVKNAKGYMQLDDPGWVDQLIDSLRDRGVSVPGADLLLSVVHETPIGDVPEAKYDGRGVVGDAECGHVAFRKFRHLLKTVPLEQVNTGVGRPESTASLSVTC